MPEPWVKLSVDDFRKVADTVRSVSGGSLTPSVSGVEYGQLEQSPDPLCWAIYPDTKNPKKYVRVAAGFVLSQGNIARIPFDPAETTPREAWRPSLKEVDFATDFKLDVSVTPPAEPELDGKQGFIYWKAPAPTETDAAKIAGYVYFAKNVADMETALAEGLQIVILGMLKWNSLDTFGYKLYQLVSSPIIMETPKAWDISFSVANDVPTVKLINCCFQRDPLFFWIGTKTATITPGAESTWLSAKINTFDGTCEILTGDYATVIDTESLPEDPTYVRKPLYWLAASGNRWRVLLDVRNLGMTLRV